MRLFGIVMGSLLFGSLGAPALVWAGSGPAGSAVSLLATLSGSKVSPQQLGTINTHLGLGTVLGNTVVRPVNRGGVKLWDEAMQTVPPSGNVSVVVTGPPPPSTPGSFSSVLLAH